LDHKLSNGRRIAPIGSGALALAAGAVVCFPLLGFWLPANAMAQSPALLEERLPVAADPGRQSADFGWIARAQFRAAAASEFSSVLRVQDDLKRYQPLAQAHEFNTPGVDRADPQSGASSKQRRAFANAGGRLSATRGDLEVALWSRATFRVRAQEGALEVARALALPEQPPAGRVLGLRSNARQSWASGVGLAHTWVLLPRSSDSDAAWLLTAGVNAVNVSNYASFESDGYIIRDPRVGGLDLNAYSFDAWAVWRDASRSFEGFGTPGVIGTGASADVSLSWRRGEQYLVNLSVVDAWSRLRFNGLASLEASLLRGAPIVDDRGYLVSRPSIEGRFSSQNTWIRTAPVVSIAAAWKPVLEGWDTRSPVLGVRLQREDWIELNAAWIAFTLSSTCSLLLEREINFRIGGLGVNCPWGHLMLRSGSLDVRESSALAASVHIRYVF